MAEITTIHVGQVFNLGNYENQRVEIDVKIQPGEDTNAAYRMAVDWINAHNLQAEREAAARLEMERRMRERDSRPGYFRVAGDVPPADDNGDPVPF